MLECVVNLSTGRARSFTDEVAALISGSLIDLHRDDAHNRTVLTLAGPALDEALRTLTKAAVAHLDIREHLGVHPRLGVVDVVPFVPLGTPGFGNGIRLDEAIAARDAFACWAGDELALPCFLYGPDRSLPEIRSRAFRHLVPDTGPTEPHPTAGACCVGARPMLVAYNFFLKEHDLVRAAEIARSIRSDAIRSLAFDVGEYVQVSCNLIAPWLAGPAEVYDLVKAQASILRAELVGLVPEALLRRIPERRWHELDVSLEQTIEFRLERQRDGK